MTSEVLRLSHIGRPTKDLPIPKEQQASFAGSMCFPKCNNCGHNFFDLAPQAHQTYPFLCSWCESDHKGRLHIVDSSPNY